MQQGRSFGGHNANATRMIISETVWQESTSVLDLVVDGVQSIPIPCLTIRAMNRERRITITSPFSSMNMTMWKRFFIVA